MRRSRWLTLVLVLVATACSGPFTRDGEHWITAGTVRIDSGSFLVSDPVYLPDILPQLTVTASVPPGSYEVKVLEGEMAEWGTRIVRVRVLFVEEMPNYKRMLGSVGIDSASVVVVDPAHMFQEWVVTGPNRDGLVVGANREEIARLLETNSFGVSERDEWSIALTDPLSNEAEKRAAALIESSKLRGADSYRKHL